MVAATSAQNLSRYGIGASEIAAVAGLNPHASPWDVWCRKTGLAPDIEPNAPMEWGHRLEPAIRQKYVDDTREMVYVPPESLFHKENKWARATPDGLILSEHLQPGNPRNWKHLLQCKNVGYWVEKAWSAAPPAYVQLQEHWEMYVTGLDRADVAVLIGGNEYRCYSIHRDDKVISDLVTIGEDFWKKVEGRIEPKVDDSDACRQHFERKFKRADAVELVADSVVEDLFTDWHEVTLRQKHDKKRLETIRNQVRKLMAEAGASSIRSVLGAASLAHHASEPVSETDWKHIAQLLGSTKCTPEEYAQLVVAATTTTTPSPKAPTLYAPRNWSKEQ